MQQQATPSTHYGRLRAQLFAERHAATVREPLTLPVSERLLQCIWYDQRLAAGLRTAAGQPLEVVSPGWWNLEAGPDFRRATIRLNGRELTGDVEIHLRADDWFHHGHHHDPLYRNVILHVTLWAAGRAPPEIPLLVLADQLAAPLAQLHDEIDLDAYPYRTPHPAGRCSEVLAHLPADRVAALLDEAGTERFAAKTRRFQRALERAGPDQVFYEGWMEALGYKANKLAFRTLAQRLPADTARALTARDQLAAVLFGVADLLPTTRADAYTKRLWAAWWKLRPDYEERRLPVGSWKLAGIRPANHPHRRVGAAAALWRRHPDLREKILAAVADRQDAGRFFSELTDEYWSRHFTLGGRRQNRALELIGAARAAEIVANIVLPFAAAHPPLAAAAADRYAALKPAPSHAILRLAGQQLFAAAASRVVKTARQQQGLIQIFQDFCLTDTSACASCQFPELVRRWQEL